MPQPRDPICAVYILASPSRSIYVGATTDLERRVLEHKTKHFAWWNQCDDWSDARAREIKLKYMHRDAKVALVNEVNPKWQDLSYALFGWSSGRFKR